jgi:CheY-like chemotaxis protein
MTQTVIIVDDNVLSARLYKALLASLDCRVLVAGSAAEAARLALADSGQPRLEAIDTSPRWSDEEEVADAPAPRPLFLVAAARELETMQELARNTGGDAVTLRKPVARDGLETLVRRHLGAGH